MTVTSKYANGWGLRGLAFLAVLGMLVAPLCSSLCAGSFCASSDSGAPAVTVACHRAEPASGEASHSRVYSQKSCTTPESFLAIWNRDESSCWFLDTGRSALTIHIAVNGEAKFALRSAFEYGLQEFSAPHPPSHTVASTVLLI
jgi:hypothetical protein